MKYMSDFIIYLYIMDKLVDLLNQFEEEKAKYWNQYCNWQYIWGRPICTTSYDMNRIVQFSDLLIISKMYEFIKWLVDNDKIDRVEVWSEWKTKPTYWFTTEPYTTCKSIKLENTILMVLSIKDNPIEFLVSILK